MKISSTLALEAPLTAATLLRDTISNGLKRSSAMGFDGVELQLNLNERNLPEFAAIAAQCKADGIAISGYATGSLYVKDGLTLISDDPLVIAETIRRLQFYINGAAVTGGKLIIGCIRGNIRDKSRFSELEARLAENLHKVLHIAHEEGIAVVLEAINRYENNFIATARQCVDFIERFRLNGLQILLDTFHMNIEETNTEEAIQVAAPYLAHIHIADNTRTVPGSGQIDFPAVLQILRRYQYDGWLSLECTVAEDESKEAANGLAYIRSILS